MLVRRPAVDEYSGGDEDGRDHHERYPHFRSPDAPVSLFQFDVDFVE